MKKIILATSFIALLLVILLSFIPTICNRYMQSAIKNIESKINVIEPDLYDKTLPAGQIQLLLDEHPEICSELGNRVIEWQENEENLSIESALSNISNKTLNRIKRITIFLQIAVIAISAIGLIAFSMYKKERTESNGSTPGIRFGE